MDARVGARLELVAPAPVTDTGDRFRLAALVAVAVAVHGWLLIHTFVTARDAVGFARTALQMESPNAVGPEGHARRSLADVLKESQHPPAYPATVLLVSLPVRTLAGGHLTDQMLLSAQLASAVAGVLLVFPTYWLGRTLFGKFPGFAAAVLFQVLPVPARVTADGLTEGLYLLTLATALLLGVRAVRRPAVGGFLLTGLATGTAYLVRPEGLLVAAAVGLTGLALGLVGRWSRSLTAAWLTALAVGFGVTAAPYMLLIGGVTNKPTGGGIIHKILNIRSEVMKAEGPAGGVPLFAAWYDPATDGPKAVWVTASVVKEAGKAFHYAPWALAAVGLWGCRRRLRAEPWLAVPLAAGALNLGLVAVLAYSRGYVSERHLLPVAFVGCFYAAFGLEAVGRRLAGWVGVSPTAASAGVLAALVLAALPATLKPMHENRAGHVHAGRWLRDRLTPADVLIDPFEWAQFYAGRSVRWIPPDPPEAKVTYAVLQGDKDENPHSHLHRYKPALDVANDGRSRVVYHWPEDLPADDKRVKVKVYQLVTQ